MFYTTEQAIEYAKKLGLDISRPSLYKYAAQYGFGHKLGGKKSNWVYDADKFKSFLTDRNKYHEEK